MLNWRYMLFGALLVICFISGRMTVSPQPDFASSAEAIVVAEVGEVCELDPEFIHHCANNRIDLRFSSNKVYFNVTDTPALIIRWQGKEVHREVYNFTPDPPKDQDID